MVYTCVKGGRKFISEAKGKRKSRQVYVNIEFYILPHVVSNFSTFKEGCPVKIKLSLSECGQYLVIVDMNFQHNHDISQAIFNHLPKQRKLNVEDIEEAHKLMKLKCNKKLLKYYFGNKTGKIITLRDLTNLNTARTKNLPKNDLTKVVEFLKQKEGSVVHVLADQNNELLGLFYSDMEMKKYFHLYPELLLCDATYKLNNLRMPLYLLIIIDVNGHCEIVATFLMACESAETITRMLQIFKETNSNWTLTHTIMTDKDMTERK